MGIIRLLLAISVVIAHTTPIFGTSLVGGKVAVQAFYIISGFYMALILNEKYIGKNGSYKLFITNRFIRLFPLYWVVLVSTVIFSVAIFYLSDGKLFPTLENYKSVATNIPTFSFLSFSNIFIFGQDVVMFLGIYPETGNLFFTSNFANTTPQLNTFLFIPQAWTLSLELTFYLFAPFLVRRKATVITGIILASLALRFYLFNGLGYNNDPWTYRFFPTEIMFFLLGCISYRVYVQYRYRTDLKTISIILLCSVLLFTILFPFIPSEPLSYVPFTIKEILYFSLIVMSIPLIFITTKKSKWDNSIGELSYPVYISHILVLMACGVVPFAIAKTGWFVSVITIVVAFILNKIIADPIEKYRQSRIKKK